jgi:hypothetical protein
MNLEAAAWYINPLIGFIVGVTDASVNHPLWAIKVRQQIGLPFTLSPSVLYRGFFPHAISSVPMDMLQVSVGHMCMDYLPDKKISYWEKRFFSGLLGGLSASLISTPVELVMTRQQQDVGFRDVLKRNPLRGFMMTALRDSIFCCGFFAGVPLSRDYLESRGLISPIACVASGLGSGVITAIISQPFDTLKSKIQACNDLVSHKKLAKEILRTEGLQGFFTGLTMRVARVSSGVLILGVMNDLLEKILIKHR